MAREDGGGLGIGKCAAIGYGRMRGLIGPVFDVDFVIIRIS